MNKINLTKTDADYYKAASMPRVIELTDKNYISIAGQGSPEADKFQKSIGVIYAVAFSIKFDYKAKDQDFVVPKMECFWRVEDEKPFEEVAKEEWHWEIMIRIPEFVKEDSVGIAIKQVMSKKENSQTGNINFKVIKSHKCVQAMHIGSWDAEQPTIQKIFDFMEENNLVMNGYHHEIYISDPRRVSEEKLKTILRYEVK